MTATIESVGDTVAVNVGELTRTRVWSAYGVAIATDIAQLALGPFGWAFSDEILDLVAMAVISRLIGFHVLLLPTFLLEFLPVSDLLPTWTGCVALVLAVKRRQQSQEPLPPSNGPVIDV